jgi:DNA polymerase-3 subunit alpha
MFATLDDLEGQVEMLIFNSAYAENESVVQVDRVLLVRGRVDHKERGETKLVVQEVEPFEPAAEELSAARAARRPPERLVLQIDAAACGPRLIDDLKSVFAGFPGNSEVVLEMRTREGTRRLRFGDGYRVRVNPALRAEIDSLLGPAALAA